MDDTSKVSIESLERKASEFFRKTGDEETVNALIECISEIRSAVEKESVSEVLMASALFSTHLFDGLLMFETEKRRAGGKMKCPGKQAAILDALMLMEAVTLKYKSANKSAEVVWRLMIDRSETPADGVLEPKNIHLQGINRYEKCDIPSVITIKRRWSEHMKVQELVKSMT